jgi:putative ABC transport system ATP-binding protein
MSVKTIPAVESMPLLKLESIGKTYRMGEVDIEILRGVSLEVFAGEFLVIVGPSGSGKTTLMNIMGGLDRASSGRIWFEGQDLSRASPKELTRYRRRAAGFVFQAYNLIPNLTARENVAVAVELSRTSLDIEEVLRLVGLADRMDHFPAQLSGGEQQRVAIARALAKNPQLLFCDEPTGALDFETGKKVLRLLIDLKSGLGKTILLITHNADIANTADRVIKIRSGEVTSVTSLADPKPPEEIAW